MLEAMLEEDRAAVCGPRYAHPSERQAYRVGQAPSQVVLGGRKVAIRHPRARHDGEEIPLPTVQAFTEANPRTAASSTRCSLGSRPASMPGAWTRWAPTSPREARAAKADD